MVLDYVAKLKRSLPLRADATIDDQWDQLNRGVMFMTLCIFGVVVTVRQYTGNIIACDGFSKFSVKFVEDYCWTQGLYTIREAYDKPLSSVPYAGILPENVPPCMEMPLRNGGHVTCPDPGDVKGPTRVYHLWYQWVPFYFWLAALAYYLPYVLYKNLGLGEVKAVITLLHSPLATDEEMEKNVAKGVTWLYHKFSGYYHRAGVGGGGSGGAVCCGLLTALTRHRLALVILLTKTCYLLTNILVFFLTSRMFSIGDYLVYGKEWTLSLLGPDNVTTSIRNRIFPKMVSCEIFRWGASGLEEEQGTCVLAPNVVNQYLFLILWFLLVFLTAANALSLLVAALKLLYTWGGYRRLLLQAFLRDEPQIKQLYFSAGMSGRVLLHMIAANVRPRVFEDCVKTLAQKLKVSIPPQNGSVSASSATAVPSAPNGECGNGTGGGVGAAVREPCLNPKLDP